MTGYAAPSCKVPTLTPELFFNMPALTLTGVKRLTGRIRLTFRDGNGKRTQRTVRGYDHPHLFLFPRTHEDIYEIMVAVGTIKVEDRLYTWGDCYRINAVDNTTLMHLYDSFHWMRSA